MRTRTAKVTRIKTRLSSSIITSAPANTIWPPRQMMARVVLYMTSIIVGMFRMTMLTARMNQWTMDRDAAGATVAVGRACSASIIACAWVAANNGRHSPFGLWLRRNSGSADFCSEDERRTPRQSALIKSPLSYTM